MATSVFISHITEEAGTAERLKEVLRRDFLGLLSVFVSSDTESIAAGEEWLRSIDSALRESSVLLILCSRTSILRPWINFEAGAAWMRAIPLVPLCHQGLEPRDLPMPLSLRQGIALNDPDGLRRLYGRIAEVLGCEVPQVSFDRLAGEIAPSAEGSVAHVPGPRSESAIRMRLHEALSHPKHRWRSLERLAVAAAVSVQEAADVLRDDPNVRFTQGKSGQTIAGLRSRVD
jgi:hypothetical protein